MNQFVRSTFKHAAQAAALACALALPALADTNYPTRPIKIIVPWSPGLPADVAARAIAERMSASMKQTVMIENRPGASGTLGYTELLKQPADGYTAYVLSSASMVLPVIYPGRPLEYTKELQAVGHLHWSYNAAVVPVDSKLGNMEAVISRAKSEPAKLTFASAGNGTPAHMAGEAFNRMASIQTTHVPYVQLPMAMNDFLGGRIDFMFLTTVAAIPQINGAKMRALAVTSAKRLPALPNTPTMVELGYRNFVFRSFETLTVKAGTPRDIVDRLNAATATAMQDPTVAKRLEELGMDAPTVAEMKPAAFAAFQKAEYARWKPILNAAGVKAE